MREINNQSTLEKYYGMNICSTGNFMYSKEDYINVAKKLQIMMAEICFIYPCNKIFKNKI